MLHLLLKHDIVPGLFGNRAVRALLTQPKRAGDPADETVIAKESAGRCMGLLVFDRAASGIWVLEHARDVECTAVEGVIVDLNGKMQIGCHEFLRLYLGHRHTVFDTFHNCRVCLVVPWSQVQELGTKLCRALASAPTWSPRLRAESIPFKVVAAVPGDLVGLFWFALRFRRGEVDGIWSDCWHGRYSR